VPNTNHIGNTANGNLIDALCSKPGFTLQGRTTNLPIYEIRYYDFKNSPLSGLNFDIVVRSIVRDNLKDAQNGYRQPTDHDDRLGNLTHAPAGRIVYREYFLSGNGFTWPGLLRLVADMGNRRLFITPTHYDVWVTVPNVAAGLNIANPVAPGAAGARNPFFLITGASAVNEVFR